MKERPTEITDLLNRIADGDRSAFSELMPAVYTEMRRLADRHMRGERDGHSMQPTDLVHEAYMRLVGIDEIEWEGRSHFLAVASTAMRRALVDHARARRAQKRGGDRDRVTMSDSLLIAGAPEMDVLDLEDALEELSALDARKVRVVELLYFGGLSAGEAAEVLEVTPRTVQRDWRFARTWLFDRLSGGLTTEGGASEPPA